MALNYASLASGPSADTVTDPQKLFQALPGKAKKYAYLRDGRPSTERPVPSRTDRLS